MIEESAPPNIDSILLSRRPQDISVVRQSKAPKKFEQARYVLEVSLKMYDLACPLKLVRCLSNWIIM